MMKSIQIPLPPLRTDLPIGVALLILKEQIVDVAITRTGYATEDGRGLAWYVLTEAEFRRRFNNAAPDPIAEPENYEGEAAAAIRNNQRIRDLFELQERSAAELRLAINNILPVSVREALEVNSSLSHLHTRDILIEMIAAFPVSEADIQFMLRLLTKPFDKTANIRAFTKSQANLLARLTDAGHTLPPLLAIAEMSKSYTSNAADRQDFAPMFAEFKMAHGSIPEQTVGHFISFVIQYVEQRLPHHREANAVCRQANVAEAVAAPVAAAAVVAPPQQHQHQPAAAGRGAQQGRGGRGGGRGPAGPAAAAPAPHPGQPRAYCHTHGAPAVGFRGHYSVSCRQPGPNHNWEATFANQMGGVVAL